MPLPENEIKSELSYAFLHAVVSRAGCDCEWSRRHSDNMGVDARLFVNERFGPASTLVRFAVEFQLKATSTPLTRVGNRLSFRLTRDHYDKLRATEVESPLLLVVLQLPAGAGEWLRCSPRALTLKGCAYWVSLYGAEESDNASSQTVYLPRGNRFTVEALRSLLERFSREERIPYVP
jgi:hypothetical protein